MKDNVIINGVSYGPFIDVRVDVMMERSFYMEKPYTGYVFGPDLAEYNMETLSLELNMGSKIAEMESGCYVTAQIFISVPQVSVDGEFNVLSIDSNLSDSIWRYELSSSIARVIFLGSGREVTSRHILAVRDGIAQIPVFPRGVIGDIVNGG